MPAVRATGSEGTGLSCLGTWSSSHSLPLAARGDTSTRSLRGWQWKNATCCQPLSRGLGMSHCPAAAAGLTSPCPCSGLMQPKEEAEGMEQGQAGRGMVTVRVSPSCSHGAPHGSWPWQEGC